MLRSILVRIFALVLCLTLVTALVAAEGVVVSLEKGKITVTVDGKEKTISLKGVKIVDANGKAVKGKDRKNALKKDAKVEITEKDGKVKQIKIK